MKYIAIIDADEKPVSCEFIGCNGNVAPYLIGATNNIKAFEQEPVLDKIRAEIKACREDEEPHLCDYRYHRNEGLEMALDIIDKYRESEGKE